MASSPRLRYLGWSAFKLESEKGNLVFDPAYRNLYGKPYAQLDDYDQTEIICITHGHSDHYDDSAAIAKRTGAQVVSSPEVCEHLKKKRKLNASQLTSVKPFERVELKGFSITAIPWRHREINFFRLLRADFFTSARFAILNLFLVPFNAPYYGYYVEEPSGLKLLNYCEGFSNAMRLDEVEEIGQRFEIDVLLAGAQLNFEEFVAEGAAALAPHTVVLFHPHKAIFDRIGLKSTPREIFVEKLAINLPQTKVLLAAPGEYLDL